MAKEQISVRLTPSTYKLPNNSLVMADGENMYTDTDSETFATISTTRNDTNAYYVCLRGFDFASIPSDAIVESFSVKFKARSDGVSIETANRAYLCNNTTTIAGSCDVINSTEQIIEFTGVTASEVYKKINDDWVLQEDLDLLFDPNMKYIQRN